MKLKVLFSLESYNFLLRGGPRLHEFALQLASVVVPGHCKLNIGPVLSFIFLLFTQIEN